MTTEERDARHIAEVTPRRVLVHIVNVLHHDCPRAYVLALALKEESK